MGISVQKETAGEDHIMMMIDITPHLMIMDTAVNAVLMTCYLLKSNRYDYITITRNNAGKEIYEQKMDIPTRKTLHTIS